MRIFSAWPRGLRHFTCILQCRGPSETSVCTCCGYRRTGQPPHLSPPGGYGRLRGLTLLTECP